MILDTLDNIPRYESLNGRFAQAVQFLQRPDLKDLPAGRQEINGDQVFAIVVQEVGRKKGEGQLEAHRNYIDIQVILDGIDEKGWKPTASCQEPTADYDPETDVQFFTDQPDVWLPTHPEQFAIFFPEDAHIPMISPDRVHMVVVKVAYP